jgi:glycosyltransferase involved in cell wall biosynthesis
MKQEGGLRFTGQAKASTPDKPLISIITVIFNGEEFLEQTLQSVQNQSYDNIEYIIVDGGSTDSTLDIVKQYSSLIDYWVSEPDDGLYDAMNKGIALATGDIIGIINSDDWYEPDTVQNIVDAFQANPEAMIVHGNMRYISENGNTLVRKHKPSLFFLKYYGMSYMHPTMFVRKEEYERHTYNSHLRSLADFQFILQTRLSNPTAIHYLDDTLANYRLGGVSTTLGLGKSLKEGLQARKSAGMNFIERLFYIIVKIGVTFINKVRNTIRPSPLDS